MRTRRRPGTSRSRGAGAGVFDAPARVRLTGRQEFLEALAVAQRVEVFQQRHDRGCAHLQHAMAARVVQAYHERQFAVLDRHAQPFTQRPHRDRAGHDLNYVGLAGLLDLTGKRDGSPIIPGVPAGTNEVVLRPCRTDRFFTNGR